MQTTSITVSGADGTPVLGYRWEPDSGPVTAVVQIVHGLAEHCARYARFAEALTAAGYAAYGHDHRGHGRTAAGDANLGHFADSDGWSKVVNDVRAVRRQIDADHPGVPVVLFGHSMGSFISRAYAATDGGTLAGLILSGTGGDPGALGKVGQLVAAVEGRVRGKKTPSPLMDKLSFGQFNAAFKPARTGYDWLSRDPAEVDKYVADPWCGQISSAGLFGDLLGGLAWVNDDKNLGRVPKTLPVYLFSGALDPVGANTVGVQKVADQYRRLGVQDVSVRFYDGARHETLNETNRDEVTADVIAWVSRVTSS